jgi:protein-tyrosine-phosphatase
MHGKEGLLKKMLEKGGKSQIQVSSAGTAAIEGFVPTANTVVVMHREGVDVSVYRTRRITPDKINKADLILAMENVHIEEVLNMVPDAQAKTHLLRKYAKVKDEPGGIEVPDPIGRPLEIYERILTMIRKSVEELVKGL